MLVPPGATVAVADGENLHLFHSGGDGTLTPLPSDVTAHQDGAQPKHHGGSANPDDKQLSEDGFAAGIADVLNGKVLDGTIKQLVIIAPPRTLGELRRHYHKALTAVLVGEIGKELSGRSPAEIEKAIIAA